MLEQGLLLENEHFSLARKIIAAALGRCGFAQRHILLLNGIPRHSGQARDMSTVAVIHAVVVLECDAEAISCRLRENTGGDRVGRQDNGPELVRKKLDVFLGRTRPLIDQYRSAGSRVYRLSIGDRTTVDEAYAQLSLLAAADPPVPLVTEPPQR